RIGGEVYELQRPEIGELAEPAAAGTVGSITMPHKRNPEASEHLDTLARLARANAAVLAEGVAAQHERDGRGWKAEGVALPGVGLRASAGLDPAAGRLGGLEVPPAAMARNLERDGGYSVSERALAALAPRLGKHRAQAELGTALAGGAGSGVTAEQALVESGLFAPDEAAELTTQPDTGACEQMTDLVIPRAHAARAAERPT